MGGTGWEILRSARREMLRGSEENRGVVLRSPRRPKDLAVCRRNARSFTPVAAATFFQDDKSLNYKTSLSVPNFSGAWKLACIGGCQAISIGFDPWLRK